MNTDHLIPRHAESISDGTISDDTSRCKTPGQRRRPSLSLHFSERRLLLGSIDVLLLNVAFLATILWRASAGTPELVLAASSPWTHVAWFGLLTALWFVSAFVFSCYDLGYAAGIVSSLACVAASLALTWFLYLLVPYVTPVLPSSRLQALAFPVLAMLLLGAWRVFYALVFVRPDFHQRALVIGAGWAGHELARAVREMERGRFRGNDAAQRNIGYHLSGFIDDDATKQAVEDIPILGNCRDLVRVAKQLRPHQLVVAITHQETMSPELFDAILECREMGIGITSMAGVYERLTGRVPVEHAGRALWVAMPTNQSATHRFYLALQRLGDMCVGLTGCLLLAFVIPFIWLANRLKSPGPLFYTQERTGREGHSFQIVKFRSMRTDAETLSGAVWAEENDPRITPVGNFLRKTRLDEIPQFWNVLKGEMSLVGPRPERPQLIAQLTREIPFLPRRHAVKPGLTGWAQTRYRYGASVEDALIKLQYDLFYIKHQNLLFDVQIALKTIPIVLGFKGR